MRKVAIEKFYWLDCWADDQVSTFARAAAIGFDGVEISFVSGPQIDWQRIRSELERLGLSVFASTGLSPATDITSQPRSNVRAAGVEYLKRCLESASRALGSPIQRMMDITTISGAPGSLGSDQHCLAADPDWVPSEVAPAARLPATILRGKQAARGATSCVRRTAPTATHTSTTCSSSCTRRRAGHE